MANRSPSSSGYPTKTLEFEPHIAEPSTKSGLSSVLPPSMLPSSIVTSSAAALQSSAEPKQHSPEQRDGPAKGNNNSGAADKHQSAATAGAKHKREAKEEVDRSTRHNDAAKESKAEKKEAAENDDKHLNGKAEEKPAPPQVPERYMKMAKFGVAVPNILQKMAADGCSQQEIALAEEQLESTQQQAEADREAKSAAASTLSAESKAGTEAKQSESSAQPPPKYMKMVQMGVPPLAVIQKMRGDACSAEEVAAVEVSERTCQFVCCCRMLCDNVR